MAVRRISGAGVALWLACLGCEPADIDPEVEVFLSESIPTVATVTWNLADGGATAAHVEFGHADLYDLTATARIDDAGRATATLMGMKQLTEYQLRVVEEFSGESLRGPGHTLETGALPFDVPDLHLEVHDPALADIGFVVTSSYAMPSAAIVIDGDGDVVWAHQPTLDWKQLHVPRALFSSDGGHVVYHAGVGYESDGTDPVLERLALRVSLDGSDEEVIALPEGHHDLLEHDDGTLAVLTYDWQTVEEREIEGDRLVEVAPDGTLHQVWTAWDHFEFDPDATYSEDLGWTHANAVDFDAATGTYHVSIHNLDCIVEIDRGTGEQLALVGGESSDFALSDGSTDLFHRQHQFELLPGGILVFDNGVSESQDSRAVEYALTDGTAEPLWEYRQDPPTYTVAMGDVQRLPSGNTLITWGSLGQMDQITPDGEVVWRLRTEIGAGFGYAGWVTRSSP